MKVFVDKHVVGGLGNPPPRWRDGRRLRGKGRRSCHHRCIAARSGQPPCKEDVNAKGNNNGSRELYSLFEVVGTFLHLITTVCLSQ